MSTEGPFRRYTCDRCRLVVLVAEGSSPQGWIGIDIRGGGRLSLTKNLCTGCTRDLDRLIFDREQVAS